MPERVEQVIARIPGDLKAWLIEEAEGNDRSLNRELRHILQETKRQRDQQRQHHAMSMRPAEG
jgi:hypothetical protein